MRVGRWRAIGIAVLLAGCASPAGPRDAGTWLAARGADVMDLVGVRVGVGPGLGVLARATRWLQLGALGRGPTSYDLAGTSGGGDGPRGVPGYMLGTIGRYGGAWSESHHEWALPGWSTRDGRITGVSREVIAGAVSSDGRDDRWEWSFAVGVHLVLIAAEVEVRPLELFDLLAGIAGYDPSGDDVPVAGVGSEGAGGADDEASI